MIVEALILGASIVGCAGCWASVVRHKFSIELQKHKINTDMEVLRPAPERPLPPPPKPDPTPEQVFAAAQQQALNELLARRRTLESNITKLRDQACQYNQYPSDDKKYAAWRSDTLKALDDARKEQQELVVEEAKLLASMRGAKNEPRLVSAEKSVQPDPGGFVARRVGDPGQLYDAELHDEEASRESSA